MEVDKKKPKPKEFKLLKRDQKEENKLDAEDNTKVEKPVKKTTEKKAEPAERPSTDNSTADDKDAKRRRPAVRVV